MVNAAIMRHFYEFYQTTGTNRDGSPIRCRRNGKVKTWKTRPGDFRAPVKYGFKTCFYIDPGSAHLWVPANVWHSCEKYGLDPRTTPLEILADRLEEDGKPELAATYRSLVAEVQSCAVAD